jgi:hypothetical protein
MVIEAVVAFTVIGDVHQILKDKERVKRGDRPEEASAFFFPLELQFETVLEDDEMEILLVEILLWVRLHPLPYPGPQLFWADPRERMNLVHGKPCIIADDTTYQIVDGLQSLGRPHVRYQDVPFISREVDYVRAVMFFEPPEEL